MYSKIVLYTSSLLMIAGAYMMKLANLVLCAYHPVNLSSPSLAQSFLPSLPPSLSLRLQRLAVILLVLHYTVEFLFHASRLLHYHGKDDIAFPG